jgi:hypothetical protein
MGLKQYVNADWFQLAHYQVNSGGIDQQQFEIFANSVNFKNLVVPRTDGVAVILYSVGL